MRIKMLLTGLLTILIAIPLFSSTLLASQIIEITTLILLFSSALAFNSLYIEAVGSGLGLFSGLFHISCLTQYFEIFLLIVGAMILLPWPFFVFRSPFSIEKTVKKEETGAGDFRGPAYSTARENKVGLEARQNLFFDKSKTMLIPEYGLIILFTTIGASFLISSSDLVSMYLSIELQSFAVYILAAIYRNSESATSAGLKYFLLGALSSALILLGSSLIYSHTGLTNFESLNILNSCSGTYSNSDSYSASDNSFILGVLLIFVGFLFKVTAAPFHNWAPDVYDGVPTIVTTWLTIMPKISIFIFLVELQNIILLSTPSLVESFNNIVLLTFNADFSLRLLLLSCTLLSLIIGTVVGLNQIKIKRLLAYSTISHVGFLLLGLVINSAESISAFMFYLLQYSITNLSAFLIILAFGYVVSPVEKAEQEPKDVSNLARKITDILYIEQFKGQFKNNPVLSLSLCVCLFSMAGIPPLIGFFGKYYILFGANNNGYYFISLIAILTSVISASYYLKIVKILNFDEKKTLFAPNKPGDGLFDESKNKNRAIALSKNIDNSKASLKGLTGWAMASNQEKASSAISVSYLHSFTIAFLTLSILLFMLNPSLILNSTHLLSLNLYYN